MARPQQLSQSLTQALRLHESGKLQDAEALYRDILRHDPKHADTLRLLATALFQQQRAEEGKAFMRQSLTLNPNQPEAHLNLAIVCREQGQLEESLRHADAALQCNPRYPEAHYLRGAIMVALGYAQEGIHAFDTCLAYAPSHPSALNDKGIALAQGGSYEEAIVIYHQLIAAHPAYANGYYNLGLAQQELKRYDEALASYEKAFGLKPDLPYLLGTMVYVKMMLCDWRGLEQFNLVLGQAIEQGIPAATPFNLIPTPLSPAIQHLCAQHCTTHSYPPRPPVWTGKRYDHDIIRIGYFSSDFHDHATAHLMAGIFEHHDRSKFNLTAFSYGPPMQDAMRQRLSAAFDDFQDVRTMTDRAIAHLAHDHEIDIAIDLKGFTQNSRPGIFAHRFSPLQVSYIGYPGTMGAPYIDYLIADAAVVPPGHMPHYSEKILWLPGCYQPNDNRRILRQRTFTRAQLGLPEQGFVFCAFNNHYKFTPDVFSLWMRLLSAVEGSVLWLLDGNPIAVRNLRAVANAHGISPERLIFAPPMPQADHIARQAEADLFLDTLPCNAHTTASDALAAGLPLLTCMGHSFAGRVAASVLQAIGLPELITHSLAEYERLALTLATDPAQLTAIKTKLLAARENSPLFDTAGYTKKLESLLMHIHQRHQSSQPPAHLLSAPA